MGRDGSAMRALIAGCGYVGSALGRDLAGRGWEVWGLRRRVERLPRAIRPWRADLSTPSTLEDSPPELDLVVYAASADDSTAAAYRTAYVDGAANLIGALDGDVERFVFVSSTAVYGQSGGEWVDETSPTRPVSFRGRILLEAEEAVLGSGLPAVVVRLGGIYGHGRTRLLERVREGEARCPPGPPVYSNRIHRDDAAGAIAHAGTVESPARRYLGIDREPAPICDVLRWLARATGAPEPAVGESGGRRRRSNKRCSSDRLVESGYAFRYPTFREGYRSLLDGEAERER